MGALEWLMPIASIQTVGLGAARTLPVVWLVPAFGGPALPGQLRMGMSLALAVLASPVLAHVRLPATPFAWALLLARELFVGVTLGLAVGTVFRAAEAAGRLADTMRGANLAEVLSATTGVRTSPLGELYLLVSVLLFVELGGLAHLAIALASSYEAVPIAPAAPLVTLGGATRVAIAASAQLMASAVALAAPVIVALLLTDVVLGVLGRLVPQLPLYFVAMPAKALLGIAVVLLGLGSLQAALTGGVRGSWVLWGAALAAWR